ncbi:unnamed protein product [Enterobius vermicularis]|uniref:Uncharacterized protein n=1 Tax=Enterobius vermicularis TaxID=51028 RepID=A0A0N4V6P4_ENTVE|nr:unnamed protein product [Enterobius vermicularis]
MEVVDQGQLIMPEQDSNPMPFKCPMHKPCRLPDSLEEADYPNNDVCSDDWCTMPQSSGADFFSGGTSNLLFLVELPDSIRSTGNQPRKVLLRILCGTDLERRLNESIIFTVLSERSAAIDIYMSTCFQLKHYQC